MKTFANIAVLPPSAKVLSANFVLGDWESARAGNPQKFYSQNVLTISRKFSQAKVSGYAVSL